MKGKIGLEEHFATEETLLDSKGYFPERTWNEVRSRILRFGGKSFVVADAVSSRTKENHQLGLERMRGAGAVMVSSEMLLFELLEKAYQQHSGGMVWIQIEDWWDPLRNDPRFQDLLKKMGFVKAMPPPK